MNRKLNLRATFNRAMSDRIESDRIESGHVTSDRTESDRAMFDRKADLRALDLGALVRRARLHAGSNSGAPDFSASHTRPAMRRAKFNRTESHRTTFNPRANSDHAKSHRANSDRAAFDVGHAASDLHGSSPPTSNLHLAVRRGGTLLLSGLATASLVVTLALAAPGKPLHHHRVHTAAVPPAAETAPAQDTSPVVARMGSLELHADQTQKLIANLNPSDRAAIDKNPDLLARVLRGLIADRFVLAQALAKHWDQQPAVAAALERMRENAIMQSYVQTVAAPPPDYPDEADLAEAYEANKAALMAPKQFQVAQIFVAAKADTDSATETQAREKILAIARELRTPGADFAAIAKTESQAKATAANGGIIGWLSEAQLRPDIKPHILALTPGAITAPIRLDDGWQILKLVDVHPPRQLDLSEVHDVLKQKMRQQRAQDLQRAWLADLVKANPISVDTAELNRLVGAAGAAQ